MSWTPEKIKQLKKLWQKGKSTVEIGKELGMSKNAVVGKVHRLALDSRPSPIKKSNMPSKRPNKIKKPVGGHGIMTLLDLRINSCRWPIGELKDENFHFCGKECQTGKPYCAEHCKIAYTSLKELTLQNAKNKKERENMTIGITAETEEKSDTEQETKKSPDKQNNQKIESIPVKKKVLNRSSKSDQTGHAIKSARKKED